MKKWNKKTLKPVAMKTMSKPQGRRWRLTMATIETDHFFRLATSSCRRFMGGVDIWQPLKLFLGKKVATGAGKDIFSCTFLLKVTVTSLPNVSIRHKGVRSREINSKRWPAILRKTLGSYSARSQTLDNFHIPTSEYRRCGFSYLLPILPQLNNVCKFPTFLMCPTKK